MLGLLAHYWINEQHGLTNYWWNDSCFSLSSKHGLHGCIHLWGKLHYLCRETLPVHSAFYKNITSWMKYFPPFLSLKYRNWYGNNDGFAKCVTVFYQSWGKWLYTLPFVVVVIVLTLDRWLTVNCIMDVIALGNTLLLYWHQSLHFYSLSAVCMSVWSYFGHTIVVNLGGKSRASRGIQIPILNCWYSLRSVYRLLRGGNLSLNFLRMVFAKFKTLTTPTH